MHQLALVRGVNTKENDHAKGQYLMHTGRPQRPGVVDPYFGACPRAIWRRPRIPCRVTFTSRPAAADKAAAKRRFWAKYGALSRQRPTAGQHRPPGVVD